MLSGVIFDMDGVLIDSHPIHRRVWRTLLKSIGKEVSERDLDFILNGAKREEILMHFLGPLSQDQIAEYGRRKEAIFHQEAENIETISGLEEFLRQLSAAEIPRAVATSAARTRTKRMLNKLGLIHYFSVIVTGDEVSRGKPDPAIFGIAAELLGVASPDLLVVEDAASGVKAAKALGMKSLGVTSSSSEQALREAGADIVVQDFKSLRLSELRQLFSQSSSHKSHPHSPVRD